MFSVVHTTNGRAKPKGRVTRASQRVKRPAGKPLPFHLQVLPQKLQRTPLHPDCADTLTHYGQTADMALEWKWHDFAMGRGLLPGSGRNTIELFGQTYHAPDSLFALAWVRAARIVCGNDAIRYTYNISAVE